MTEQEDKNLETRATDREIIKDVFIPSRLSKRLVRGVNPETEAPIYAGLVITGLTTQVVLYSPVIYGIYKTLETGF